MDLMWLFLLVDEPGEVMNDIWPPMGLCYYLLYMLYFWVELPVQRRLCPIFVKLWVPVKGTQ